MADPAYYNTDAQGNQVPVYQTGTPGFSGAIQDFVRALAQAFAPKSITQRGAYLNQKIDEADPQPQQSSKLGDQF